MGLELGDGDSLLWGDDDAPFKQLEDLRRSEELDAMVRANVVCLVAVTRPLG